MKERFVDLKDYLRPGVELTPELTERLDKASDIMEDSIAKRLLKLLPCDPARH